MAHTAAGDSLVRKSDLEFVLVLVSFFNMPIVVIGLSHHTSPVEMRERFAFVEARIPEALQRLRSNGVADEAVILSTCNRVEIYAATTNSDRPAFQGLRRFLVEWCDYRGPLCDGMYTLGEPQRMEHLFTV